MTRAVTSVVLTFALALWAGGAIWLFVSVSKLFAIDHRTAAAIAPSFFQAFNRYQLVLGIIACAAALVLWRSDRRKASALPLACVAGAMILVLAIFQVTSRLETLRGNGEATGMQFKQLHGLSMVLYLGTTLLTALALGSLSWARVSEHRPAAGGTATPGR
ncbi:MAG TPA: DUF4149 domain-containing protein [Tepidisphaeraceae bacterium]|jgi:glucan phosphoethanolaminetransferase (alkaline phosphatase superfamily)